MKLKPGAGCLLSHQVKKQIRPTSIVQLHLHRAVMYAMLPVFGNSCVTVNVK